jgi:hypothetical protein
LEFDPAQSRFVTKLYTPPFPNSFPEYQFCTVEYFIVAFSNAISSTTAAVDLYHTVEQYILQDNLLTGCSFKLTRFWIINSEYVDRSKDK